MGISGDLKEFNGARVVRQVAGVGKDAPTVTNEHGARQSKTLYRMDLLPPLASLAVAEVLAVGCAKYGKNNWHGISVEDHLNHALIHIYSHLAGDTQDDHLEHAACRMMMALEIHKMGGPKTQPPEIAK